MYRKKIFLIAIVGAVFIILGLSILLMFNNFSINSDTKKEPQFDKSQLEYYKNIFYSKGKVFTNLSRNFDINLERCEIYYDKEVKKNRLFYRVLIRNKTDRPMRDIVVRIILNEKMAKYIASGITEYTFEPVDLVPGKVPLSAGFSTRPALFDIEKMSEKDKEDFQELMKEITLSIQWDGGQEKVVLEP